MPTRTPKQIVDEAYAAIMEHDDLDGFLRDFDDNSILVEADCFPYGGRYQGKDAIASVFRHIVGLWDDFRLVIECRAYGDDCGVIYGTLTGVARATGKAISMPIAEVWKIGDGKVRELIVVYGDSKQALDALGAIG